VKSDCYCMVHSRVVVLKHNHVIVRMHVHSPGNPLQTCNLHSQLSLMDRRWGFHIRDVSAVASYIRVMQYLDPIHRSFGH
jgi:hypothetical protein